MERPIANKHKCPVRIWRKLSGRQKQEYNSFMSSTSLSLKDMGMFFPPAFHSLLTKRSFNTIRHNLACLYVWKNE